MQGITCPLVGRPAHILCVLSLRWVPPVQLCGEDPGAAGEHHQKATGGDGSQDLRAGQGLHEGQGQGKPAPPPVGLRGAFLLHVGPPVLLHVWPPLLLLVKA